MVALGKVRAIGFGWELFVVSVPALARKAAKSAGLIPASSCSELINEGRLPSLFNSWTTAGVKGGSRAWAWSANNERMMMGSILLNGFFDGMMMLLMRLRSSSMRCETC